MTRFLHIRLFFLTPLFTALLALQGYSQPSCYFNLGVFNTPTNEPFIETNLTIQGNSLFAKEVEGKFQNSVNIRFTVLKDSTIIKANKYNLNGPLFDDNSASPVFIDNQRYSLANGSYVIEIILTDNYNPAQKPYTIKQTINLNYTSTKIQCSSIQALESYKKSFIPGPLTKSGYDLVPYTINYFPETSKELLFILKLIILTRFLEKASHLCITIIWKTVKITRNSTTTARSKNKSAQRSTLYWLN